MIINNYIVVYTLLSKMKFMKISKSEVNNAIIILNFEANADPVIDIRSFLYSNQK